MSFETVTLFQLVCDGCEREYEPWAGESPYYDNTAEALDVACESGGWVEVGDKAYCPACSWECDCGKTALGSPPVTGMCEECERNQRGRLIDVTEDYERCPGSGRPLCPPMGDTAARCPCCPARVPVIVTEEKSRMATHLRRRMFNPSAFEVGTRIRDVWTNEVFEVVEHKSHTGMTELRAPGTGLLSLENSLNNARYVAVAEAPK